MAIDNPDKRKSTVNWLRRILPIPDSLISAADRIHVAGLYRGLIKTLYDTTVSINLLLNKLNIDIFISSDIVLKKLNILRSISSDVLFKKLDILKAISSDILIYNQLVKQLTSDLIIKKNNIIKSITSNILLLKQVDISFTIDTLFRKLGFIKSVTIDTIIEEGEYGEHVNLNSYINISEDINSVIIMIVNDSSNVLMSLSKFSETDSDVSISRYSVINSDQS